MSWVVGNRNQCYVGQDTNTAIESYHGKLKTTLRQSKGRYHGRIVDWPIHQLLGSVLNHSWYMALRKQHGFVTNKNNVNFFCNKRSFESEIDYGFLHFLAFLVRWP